MDSTDSDSSNSLQLKVMYIECESDLTEEEKSAIHKTGVGHGKSLVVCRKPKRYEVFNDDGIIPKFVHAVKIIIVFVV